MSKPNRKVIRLQQMRAQRAEAAGIKHVDLVYEVPGDDEYTYRERTCSFLTQDYWPVEIVESVRQGDDDSNIGVLRKIASPPEAFDELLTVARFTVGELKHLIEELSGEAGTDEGEGSGSSTSSGNTQEPSEPTSSGTTPVAA